LVCWMSPRQVWSQWQMQQQWQPTSFFQCRVLWGSFPQA
jgi:hypothetical protein